MQGVFYMTPLSSEITELQAIHAGLAKCEVDNNGLVVSGLLDFTAEPEGFAPITECFAIAMSIPGTYPEELPKLKETGGRVEQGYSHVFLDGSLCLGVPVEIRRAFSLQPSLLGFVNRLVIPFFYGFCHWKQFGDHPFGEHAHNGKGILEYYKEALNLAKEESAIAFLLHLFQHGYRGHHECPCGSGKKLRKCHGPILLELKQHHTSHTLTYEMIHTLDYLLRAIHTQDTQFSTKFINQINRFIQRNGSKLFRS